MKRLLSMIVLTCALASCGDHGTGPVSDPFERWQSHHFHDYTIDQMRICYCINGGQTMTITVRADTIARVVRVSDGTQLSSSSSGAYLTVDSLFGVIRHAHGDSLVVAYNGDFGYPERLDINPQLHPVDGGALYETSNLRVP
jgi:hypothetical protein